MASKPKAKKPAPQKETTQPTAPLIDTTNIQFWRSVVNNGLNGEEKDDQKIMSWAVAMRLFFELLPENYAEMNRIAKRTDDKLKMNAKFFIDYSATPAVVKVGIGFSDAHKAKGESDVPDPNSPELPGISAPEAEAVESAQ